MDIAFLIDILRFPLLMIGVDLDLVDGGFHFIGHNEINEPVIIEIAHSDSADFSVVVELFQCPPCTVHVTERLMNKIEVKIRKLEAVKSQLKSLFRLFIPGVLEPQFGGDEQFLAVDTAVFYASAHMLFIGIILGRINKSPANIDGFGNTVGACG